MFHFSLQWLVLITDVSVKAFLIALAAMFVIRVFRLRDSYVRHGIWTGVLLGTLALPVLLQFVPPLRLPLAIPSHWTTARFDNYDSADDVASDLIMANARQLDGKSQSLQHGPRNNSSLQWHPDFSEAFGHAQSDFVSGSSRFERSITDSSRTTGDRLLSESTIADSKRSEEGLPASDSFGGLVTPRRWNWRTIDETSWQGRFMTVGPILLLGIWLIGTAFLSLRLLIGMLLANRLLRSSTLIDSSQLIESRVEHRFTNRKCRHDLIYECSRVHVPLTIGILRPKILLPADWREWPTEKLRTVLIHERTHIDRADGLVGLLAESNCCLYWFHPLSWWLRRHLARLAEAACDDAAIRSIGNRALYARYLLDVASAVSTHHGRILPYGVSMARQSDVEARIHSILDVTRPLSQRITWVTTLLIAAVAVPVVTLAAALSPQANGNTQQTNEAIVDDRAGAPPDELPENATAREEEDEEVGVAAAETPPRDPTPATPRAVAPVAAPKTETPQTYSGRVTDAEGNPIAGATIWLSLGHGFSGAIHELGKSDDNGDFQGELDENISREMMANGRGYPAGIPQVVGTAPGYGIDVRPFHGFFEPTPEHSLERNIIAAIVGRALGKDRFTGRTLVLPRELEPIRGRLLNLEGEPLSNVLVSVDSIQNVDIKGLDEAFEHSSHDLANRAKNAGAMPGSRVGPEQLRRVLPPVSTDERGEFTLSGIGRDQLAELTVVGERVESQRIRVLGRSMSPQRIPHTRGATSGAQDIYVGTQFTHVLGPAIPIQGVVTDFQTREPIPNTTVFVERLFSGSQSGPDAKMRFDTGHIRAVTDENGRFRLTGIPPGERHVLNAVPPTTQPWFVASREFSLGAEDLSADIDIQVFRGIWIEGRVTDTATGEPIRGTVDYRSLPRNPRSHRDFGLEVGVERDRFRIDETGAYRVAGLPGPGVLLVRSFLSKTFYPFAEGAEDVEGYDNRQMYIPTLPQPTWITDWNRIQQINPDLDAESYEYDLTLTAVDAVAGRAVGPDDVPVSGLEVMSFGDKAPSWSFRDDDRFVVRNYDGKPRVLFFKTTDNLLVGHFQLEGDPPRDFVVKLEPAVSVTGRLIEKETGKAAAGYTLFCDSTTLGEFRIGTITTSSDGRFEMNGLMAGVVYDMNASDPQRVVSGGNRFQIDLTQAKPGDVIDLGEISRND